MVLVLWASLVFQSLGISIEHFPHFKFSLDTTGYLLFLEKDINKAVNDEIYQEYIHLTWIFPRQIIAPRWPSIMSIFYNCKTISLSISITLWVIDHMASIICSTNCRFVPTTYGFTANTTCRIWRECVNCPIIEIFYAKNIVFKCPIFMWFEGHITTSPMILEDLLPSSTIPIKDNNKQRSCGTFLEPARLGLSPPFSSLSHSWEAPRTM